ncbi:hypothetical protein FFF93_001545 [Arthrobacter sp. KBS0702]|uniref:hypothetical protein n=1 Tax=Arthrobacter sp. KBS0702 TaxID=2578107 RepID=UPI00110D7A35|nr:hypothetical protein [Arthrobacter sp. KBS0702]QDW28613.1 hypothetical protein FFF93_001545 [Arthrobacter sp. KBS0702]
MLFPELEFLMDATLDQIPDFPLQRVIRPADELSHDEPATFGTDDAWGGYLLVDDVIDLKPEHRDLIMGSGQRWPARAYRLNSAKKPSPRTPSSSSGWWIERRRVFMTAGPALPNCRLQVG